MEQETRYDYDPQIWGSNFWNVLYTVAAGYPENPTQVTGMGYYQFFNNLAIVLPCSKCRKQLEEYYRQLDETNPEWDIGAFAGRSALLNFVYNMHADVQKRNNLSSLPPFVEMEQKYVRDGTLYIPERISCCNPSTETTESSQ